MITRDDWLKALADCIVREDDATALSYRELGELFGLCPTATHSKVQRLLKAGRLTPTHKYVNGRHVIAFRLAIPPPT